MSFTFNYVNSDDLGLVVEKYPDRVFPQRKAEVFDIPGRSGDLVVDDDAFSNVVQPYEVYISGGVSGMQQRAREIAHWLLNAKGYGRLTDSYTPGVYRNARVVGGASFLNALNKFGRGVLEFDCKPQRFPTDEEVLTGTFGTSFAIVRAGELFDGYPLIEISNFTTACSGYLKVINAQGTTLCTITIPEQTEDRSIITIDFETEAISGLPSRPLAVTINGKMTKLGLGCTIQTVLETGTTPPTVNIKTRRFYL